MIKNAKDNILFGFQKPLQLILANLMNKIKQWLRQKFCKHELSTWYSIKYENPGYPFSSPQAAQLETDGTCKHCKKHIWPMLRVSREQN